MKYQHVSVAIAAFALLVSGATTAAAQGGAKRTATAVSAPPPMGPSIPGFCVVARQGIIAASISGKFAIARYKELKQQSDAELQTEGTALQGEIKAFQDQRATLPADQVNARGSALQAKYEQFQRKQQLRDAEMQATQQKAFGTVLQAADPIVQQVFVQRGCSVLIEGTPVLLAAPSMDITQAVVQSLDTKLQKFDLERVRIDPSQGGQQR